MMSAHEVHDARVACRQASREVDDLEGQITATDDPLEITKLQAQLDQAKSHARDCRSLLTSLLDCVSVR